MGKRRKRLTMAKYAAKYATKRAALGFDIRKVENKMIEIDMTSGEEVKEDETVQVVVNTPKKEEKVKQTPPWDLEPGLQTVQIEEPQAEVPPPPPKKVATKRKTSTRRASTRKTTTSKTEE